MKKTIKKISILLFLSIIMMGINITHPVIAGEEETGDGMSRARVNYSGSSRLLSLDAIMRSSSGEFNDRVYFTINETDYDMDPYIYVEGNKNILQYYYYLSGLDYGIYEIKFFHENSTDTYEYDEIFTVNITEYEFDIAGSTQFGWNRIEQNTNNIEFYAYWNNDELSKEIDNLYLNINGTSEVMIWDDCDERYLFEKDFGINNSNTYNYSISFSIGKENYQTNNKSIYVSNRPQTSHLYASIYPLYNPGTLDFNAKISFQSWQNVEPTLILEIDGENSTLEPKFDFQNIQCEDLTDIDWTNYQNLGMYSISGLEKGENHTINVYAFDGIKWYSFNVMDNETLATPLDIEDFTVDVLNWNVTFDSDYHAYAFNIDINVTCPYVTHAYERDDAYISIYGPWTDRPIFTAMTPYNWNDCDFSDGKLFRFSYYNWDSIDGFGELTAKFHIFYRNQTFTPTTTTTFGRYISSNYTFSMSETPVAEFGINKDDWFVYETGYKLDYRDCDYCNMESSSYYLYKVVDFGYELGVNYIDLEKYAWVRCNETWIYNCPNYNVQMEMYYDNHFSLPGYVSNVSMRIWININNNRSIEDWVFLPLNNISNYLEYFGHEYYEDNVKISSYSAEISSKLGNAEFYEVIEIDKDGFLKEYSINREYGKYYTYTGYTKLINYGNGNIPETNEEKANVGSTISIIVIVLGISVAGVVITYKSNKFPQFNSFLEKFKKY